MHVTQYLSNYIKREYLYVGGPEKLDKTHICAVYKAALQSKSIYNLLDLVPKVIYILRAADGMSINDVNIFEGGGTVLWMGFYADIFLEIKMVQWI